MRRYRRFISAGAVVGLMATALAVSSGAQAFVGTPPFDVQLPFAVDTPIRANAPHKDDPNRDLWPSVDLGAASGAKVNVYAPIGGRYHIERTIGGTACRVSITQGIWSISLLHLTDATSIPEGTTIAAGRLLGATGDPTIDTCGEGAGRHVHLTLYQNGAPTSIEGFSIGGYTVHSNGNIGCGTWTRNKGNLTVVTTATSGGPDGCDMVPGPPNSPGMVNDQLPVKMQLAGGTWNPAGVFLDMKPPAADPASPFAGFDTQQTVHVTDPAGAGLRGKCSAGVEEQNFGHAFCVFGSDVPRRGTYKVRTGFNNLLLEDSFTISRPAIRQAPPPVSVRVNGQSSVTVTVVNVPNARSFRIILSEANGAVLRWNNGQLAFHDIKVLVGDAFTFSTMTGLTLQNGAPLVPGAQYKATVWAFDYDVSFAVMPNQADATTGSATWTQ